MLGSLYLMLSFLEQDAGLGMMHRSRNQNLSETSTQREALMRTNWQQTTSKCSDAHIHPIKSYFYRWLLDIIFHS